MGDESRQGEGERSRSRDGERRQAQEGQGEHAGERDVMQDAEEDEVRPNRQEGAERHQRRRARDHGEALQIGRPVQSVARRENEADADEREEGAGDQPCEDAPARLGRHIHVDQAEIGEVEGEMEDEHRQQRETAGDVDEVDARARDDAVAA